MSSHHPRTPLQRPLPVVGSRRLDPGWRARKYEQLEVERELMLRDIVIAELQVEREELRRRLRRYEE